MQGSGLGGALLADAMRRSLRAAEEVGIRAVIVEALDESAADFYRRYGFQPLVSDPLLLMATAAQLRAAAS